MPTLYATWAGQAASGATYHMEIWELTPWAYELRSFSAASSGSLMQQGKKLFESPERAVAAMTVIIADKRKPGRPRVYELGYPGTAAAGTVTPPLTAARPITRATIAAHPQVWVPGSPIEQLPPVNGLRTNNTPTPVSRAPLRPAAPATPAAVAPTPPPPDPMADRLPVMLCQTGTITDVEPFLTDSIRWIAMRKVEGRRAILSVLPDGRIELRNRSGEIVACPEAIFTAAQQFRYPITLDGELVAMTADGREALYAGSAAQRITFVAFDLLLVPGMSAPRSISMIREMQRQRLTMLRNFLDQLDPTSPIRLVEVAISPAEKAALLDRAIREGWEGIVFRDNDAPYVNGRSSAWQRYKLRYTDYDLIVMGYQDGKGRLAGSVGAVSVGLYDRGRIVPVGEVGSGLTDADRATLVAKRDAGAVGYVITVRAEGRSAAGQLIRPVFVGFRAAGDKPATDCTIAEIADLPVFDAGAAPMRGARR